MKISIFGLGYVGAVTAACLARRGHAIVGVDVHAQKVEAFQQGVPPIVEPGLDELLREAKQQGRLRATLHCPEAVAASDLCIICVGTPSTVAGALDLAFVRGVTQQIAEALRAQPKPHVLVYRSTLLPGTTAQLTEELLGDLAASGQLQIFFYPEFLRESTAVRDFEEPALSLVGTRHGTPPPAALMTDLFGTRATVTDWGTAEMVKYVCNLFHGTKITFANEVGRLAKQLGLDARRVMELMCQDTKLNLSPAYLQPGNPFGGSCLPKDIRAVAHHARHHGLDLPLIESLLPSNAGHLQSLFSLIMDSGQNEVIILGLAFKSGTDDLRESSMVEVAQTLLGRGYKVRIYDPALNLAAMVGSNKRAIDSRMPHLASLLSPSLGQALGRQGLVLAAQKCVTLPELRKFITPQHHVLDINGWPELKELPARYVGFCW